MSKQKRKKSFNVEYERKTIPASLVDADSGMEDYDKKDLRARAVLRFERTA